MNPIVENLLISLCTAAVAVSAAIQQVGADGTRDWVIISSVGVSAFAGTLINGYRPRMRQRQKESRP